MAEWSCRGLQILLRRFDSGLSLIFYSSHGEGCRLEESGWLHSNLSSKSQVGYIVTLNSPTSVRFRLDLIVLDFQINKNFTFPKRPLRTLLYEYQTFR